MAEHAHTSDHAAHSHHITPQSTLFKVFGLLFLFMVATIGAANYMPEAIKGNSLIMNTIALGIAVVKASLVIMYFMGVKFTTRLVKIYAIGGFVWFFTLYIMLADYMTRPYEPVRGWEKTSSTSLPRGVTGEGE